MPAPGVYKGGLTLAERVAELTMPEPNSGCWLWLGLLGKDGYGRINGRQAHTVSYEIHIGPIPSGLVPDHQCRLHPCVNPWHLESVTNRVNILRGTAPSALNAVKTHCKRGHAFDEANTYVAFAGTKAQERRCKTCQRANEQRRRERRASQRIDAEAAS